MLRVVVVFLFLTWASLAAAQQKVSIDPSAIKYEPRLVALRGCGFSIGVDASWSHEVRNRDGKVVHEFLVHNLPPGAMGRFRDDYLGPITNIAVYCERAEPSTDRGRTAYNRTMATLRDDAVARGEKSVSRVTPANYGPFTNGLQYSWDSTSIEGSDVHASISGNIFAHVGDTRVRIWFLQGTTKPGDARKLPAGTEVQVSRSLNAVITSPVAIKPSGAMFAIRTLDMERRFIQTVLSTIR